MDWKDTVFVIIVLIVIALLITSFALADVAENEEFKCDGYCDALGYDNGDATWKGWPAGLSDSVCVCESHYPQVRDDNE